MPASIASPPMVARRLVDGKCNLRVGEKHRGDQGQQNQYELNHEKYRN